MATTAAFASTSSCRLTTYGMQSVRGAVPALPKSSRTFSSTSHVQAKPRRQRMANDDFALDKMGKFNFDDLPTLGHEALARQRELLHYARLVEWELPKLQALRSTYEPPAKDAILRLRSLHYQGQAHPATRKAVLTVKVSELFESGRLTSEAARRKLLLIAGARWDPLEQQPDQSSEHGFHLHAEHSQIEKLALASGVGTIKISCERFPHERMNIKWCSDTVDKMLREANENPEAMADVPLDLRHVKAREASRKSFARHDGPSKRDFPAQWLPKIN